MIFSDEQGKTLRQHYGEFHGDEEWRRELARRRGVSTELQGLIEKTQLLKGKDLDKAQLAEVIKLVWQIQNLQAISLPKLIGNYEYNVYFKDYEGSREAFAEKMGAERPGWKEGSTGHEGADLEKLSEAFRIALGAESGTEFVHGFGRLLRLPGVGPGFATGVLVLWDPQRYGLVNGGARAPFEKRGVCELKKSQLKQAKAAVPEYFKVPGDSLTGSVQANLSWMVIFNEVKQVVQADDFLEVDFLLWSLSKIKPPALQTWKIAPGEQGWQWDECLEGGFIGLGWDAMGDVSGLTKEEFDERAAEMAAERDDWSEEGIKQLWTFVSAVREGDQIVANRGTREVLGIGTVIGPHYFVENERNSHRLPVSWDDTSSKAVNFPGWRRTLVKLSSQDMKAILDRPVVVPNGGGVFSARSFELLSLLQNRPEKAVYDEHKSEFAEHVEGPIQSIMAEVAAKLRPDILDLMETEKRVFSRIPKNDYGRGGAWPHYWGAFYPKGGKRIEDAQLHLSINHEGLDFGFYFGEYGSKQRRRFVSNCSTFRSALEPVFRDYVDSGEFEYGTRESVSDHDESRVSEAAGWREWISRPEEKGIRVGVPMRRENAVSLSRSELVGRIVETFERLFPLVYLATSDDPMPLITDYIGDIGDDEAEIAPEYPLETMAMDTGLELPELERWVAAIERKRQGVLYGPPGTGKTFVAEHLARHFVGGSDGFVELVQFHPAYAYEDFIQGLRPEGRDGGGLDYRLMPGRFLEFCRKAGSRKGRCVLIIDEINRANLSRVFGELMYLLEYRDNEVPLAAGERLRIPANVRLIGTMNTADRSIALVDHALRRRFAFIPLYPQYDVLVKFHEGGKVNVEALVGQLRRLNKAIGDRHYEVGISFFLKPDLELHLEDIWRMEVEPYLEEYFFDQPTKVDEFRWDKVGGQIL